MAPRSRKKRKRREPALAPAEQAAFWKSILVAAGAEVRSATSIPGASGIIHPVVAVGVDDARRRLIVISGEHDARSASLAQADIQAAVSTLRVVVARPLTVNLSEAAKALSDAAGSLSLDLEAFAKFKGDSPNPVDEGKALASILGPAFDKMGRAFSAPSLNLPAQWMQVIQQLGRIELERGPPTLGLRELVAFDPMADDRKLGVCPIPLYAFSESDFALLSSGGSPDEVRELLRGHGLLQFFFPPADQLALGLIDRGTTEKSQVLAQVQNAQQLGHPLGSPEITEAATKVTHVVDALRERGLIVEGEMGFEVALEGRSVRAKVQFKPSESLLSKLINRVSVSLNLKDLFGVSAKGDD